MNAKNKVMIFGVFLNTLHKCSIWLCFDVHGQMLDSRHMLLCDCVIATYVQYFNLNTSMSAGRIWIVAFERLCSILQLHLALHTCRRKSCVTLGCGLRLQSACSFACLRYLRLRILVWYGIFMFKSI